MTDNRPDIILLAALKGAIVSLPENTPEEIGKKIEASKLYERVEMNSRRILRLRDENKEHSDKICAIIEETFHMGGHE